MDDTFRLAAPLATGPRVRVAAAVVWDDGRLLMTRRPPGGPLGLQWEFPGGKLEPGETPEHAVVREVLEELGVTATVLETLERVRHDYDHGTAVEITFLRCVLASHAFVPGPGIHELRWWRPGEIPIDQVLAADRPFLVRRGASAPGEGA